MSSLLREIGFVIRTPVGAAAIVLLLLLSSLATGLGLQETARQRAAIERLVAMQAEEAAAVQRFAQEAGAAAYYRFHATWDPPSDLAFAALGQRDVAPTMLRVRALALEGQIYESEAFNPELALVGRFDLAFVLVYLAPLVLIALLHDLWSGEREAGRLALLQAGPRAAWRVWGARASARILLVAAAILTPFAVGAALQGAGLAQTAAFAGVGFTLLVFWSLVALAVARLSRRSVASAATLAAFWFAVTLVAPAAAHLAINAAIPIPHGADLARENREAVHDAWDVDRNATLTRFYALYPEYAASAPMERPFHWKWYFAFQHLGDLHVADLSRAYREGIAARDAAAEIVGWALPPIGLQRAMHRLANTDMAAQLAYQDRIRAFHARLRRFYYPYLFEDRPFAAADFARTPEFDPAAAPRD